MIQLQGQMGEKFSQICGIEMGFIITGMFLLAYLPYGFLSVAPGVLDTWHQSALST